MGGAKRSGPFSQKADRPSDLFLLGGQLEEDLFQGRAFPFRLASELLQRAFPQ